MTTLPQHRPVGVILAGMPCHSIRLVHQDAFVLDHELILGCIACCNQGRERTMRGRMIWQAHAHLFMETSGKQDHHPSIADSLRECFPNSTNFFTAQRPHLTRMQSSADLRSAGLHNSIASAGTQRWGRMERSCGPVVDCIRGSGSWSPEARECCCQKRDCRQNSTLLEVEDSMLGPKLVQRVHHARLEELWTGSTHLLVARVEPDVFRKRTLAARRQIELGREDAQGGVRDFLPLYGLTLKPSIRP